MTLIFSSRLQGRWYRADGWLGRGGYADVYRCVVISQALSFGMLRFAIKVLRDAWDSEIFKRFSDEALVLQRLKHPNLMPVLEINLEHKPPYYVMPMMKETLRAHLAQKQRGREVYRAKFALTNFLVPLSDAVRFLHANGVIHRDINPNNIFLDWKCNARLGDLGICHRQSNSRDLRTWCGLGTPRYTAP